MDHRFPKSERLKGKALIDRLFSEGKTVFKQPVKLYWVPASFEGKLKIKAGMGVPKRDFKRAVDRNRIKRLLREAYRLNKHLTENIPGQFAFMFIYVGKEIPRFDVVERAVIDILEQFESNWD